jgi:hypothetical protein
MPVIKSKSLGAPGSSGGAVVIGPIRGFAARTRFFGWRRVERIGCERLMCDY